MKKIVYILFSILLTGFYACETDYDAADQGITLEELPKYVAFSVSGVVTTIDDIDVSEADGDTDDEINVEIPGGTTSDVTVNFAFSGTAVYGTDFTVDGGTSAGGSVTIKYDNTPNIDGLPFNADLVVNLLKDDLQDGNKTLIITLTSASNADGEIAVGRAGTDLLKTVTINISDVDCGDVAGVYDVAGTILVDDFGSGPYAYTDQIALADCSTEGEYLISDITGGLYTNDYATAYGVDPASAVIEFDPTMDGPVTWSDVSDQFDGEVLEDPLAAEPSNYDATNGIITIYWTATAYGERGITVYTVQP